MRRVRPSGTPLTWSGRPRALRAPLAPLTTLLASLFYLPLITSGGFAASKKSGKNRTKIWIFFWNSRKKSRFFADFRIPEFWKKFQNTKGMLRTSAIIILSRIYVTTFTASGWASVFRMNLWKTKTGPGYAKYRIPDETRAKIHKFSRLRRAQIASGGAARRDGSQGAFGASKLWNQLDITDHPVPRN